MTMMDTGTTGAKRQSWAHSNPRDMLRQLIEDHPNWDRERLLKEFRKQALNSPGYVDVIVEYWFANNFHSLVDHRRNEHSSTHKQKAAISVTKKKIKEHITKEAQILLLEMMMPNGKKLGNCTGLECKELATKMGGWLIRIANSIKPNDIVGNVLDENQVRELYTKTRI